MSEVVHPAHYNSHPSGVEVIEYARLLPFGPGSAVKYVMRHQHKGNPRQDLDKALWLLDDSIEHDGLYRTTGQMREVITPVLAVEPDPIIVRFLTALYTPLIPVSHLRSARRCVDQLLAATP